MKRRIFFAFAALLAFGFFKTAAGQNQPVVPSEQTIIDLMEDVDIKISTLEHDLAHRDLSLKMLRESVEKRVRPEVVLADLSRFQSESRRFFKDRLSVQLNFAKLPHHKADSLSPGLKNRLEIWLTSHEGRFDRLLKIKELDDETGKLIDRAEKKTEELRKKLDRLDRLYPAWFNWRAHLTRLPVFI